MDLRAKCLRDLADPADGERLHVSRVRPRGLTRVDGWERRLAPSTRLDFALYGRWITWREYAGLYVADMWSRAAVLRGSCPAACVTSSAPTSTPVAATRCCAA